MAQGVALSWWVLQQTGDAVWLSVLTFATWGPTLLAGAWGGALVDRSDRRRLLLVTQATLLGIAAALAGLAATGHLAILAAMTGLGVTSIWFIASANTLAQLRCRPDMRGRVMALWGMAMTGVAPVAGFGVAAVVQYVGPREGFAVSGVLLAAATAAGWRALQE